MRRLVRAVQDVTYLAFGRYGAYLVTLLTLPFLARLLGVSEYGTLAIGMSAYFIGSIVVDLGVSQLWIADVTAGRLRIADRIQYSRIRLGVLSLLILAAILGFLVGNATISAVFVGMLAGGLSSTNESYVLFGQMKFGYATLAQTVGRLSYLALLFLVLPLWRTAVVALCCLAASNVITNLVTWQKTRRIRVDEVAEGLSQSHNAVAIIRAGFPIALGRVVASLTGQGASILYAGFVPINAIGLYAAGDKLLRAAQSIFDSVGLAFLPRISRKLTREREFWRMAAIVATANGIFATVVMIAYQLLAGVAITILFGQMYVEAVALSRIQAIMLPAVAVTTSLINTVLYPLKMRRTILLVSIIGSAVTAAGVCVSAVTHDVWTMVIVSVLTEWSACAFVVATSLLVRSRRSSDA